MKRLGILLLSIMLISGCGSINAVNLVSKLLDAEKAKEFFTGYLQLLDSGKYDQAYDSLTKASKKKVSREDYIYLAKLRKEVYQSISSSVQVERLLENATMDDATYSEGIGFSELLTYKPVYEVKQRTERFHYLVVNENNHWRVYLITADKYRETISKLLNEIAYEYFNGEGRQKNTDQALKYYTEALSYDPKSRQAYMGSAVVLESAGKYEEAEKILRQGIATCDKTADLSDLYNGLGDIYLDVKDYRHSEESIRKALELNPDNQKAQQTLQSIHQQTKSTRS